MNSRVHFAIYLAIGIAAIAVLVYAYFQPLASLSVSIGDIKVSSDLYIDKECSVLSGSRLFDQDTCDEPKDKVKSHLQAIMGVAIALIACLILKFITMNFGGLVCSIVGLLILGLSIALIVLFATLINVGIKFLLTDKTYYYELTNTSIAALVVASLLVLIELCCNNLLHKAIMAPFRLIAGKKRS